MPEKRKVTQSFLDGHAALRGELRRHEAAVGELRRAGPQEAAATMDRVVVFLDEEIRPHATWEEVRLYPLLDSIVGGREPFTATMRHEHAVVDRWIEELAVTAAAPAPDVERFARRADRLFGLVEAHWEAEEAALLPVLERAYATADEFERAVGEVHAHSH